MPYGITEPKSVALRPLVGGMNRVDPPQSLNDVECITAQNLIIRQGGPQKRGGFGPTSGTSVDISTVGNLEDMLLFWDTTGTLKKVVITRNGLYIFDDADGFTEIEAAAFTPSSRSRIDWTIAQTLDTSYAVFTDGSNPPQKFDGTTLDELNSSIASPTCCEFFDGRLWLGAPETVDNGRQKVIWSDVAAPDTFQATSYITLAGTATEIIRIAELGPVLIFYFTDAVYYARKTNISTLPYLPEKFEKDNIGLVGAKALAKAEDGHFYVGQDDVYFISPNLGVERIGTKVIDAMLDGCQHKEFIQAVSVPEIDSVLFGIPGTTETIETVWCFNYKTKAWSFWEVSLSMLANIGNFETISWDDATGVTYESNPWSDWASVETSLGGKKLYGGYDGELYAYSPLVTRDFGTEPIVVEYESKDFDFGMPDMDKTANRLNLKLERVLTQDISFDFWTSTDRGNTFTLEDSVPLFTGYDEVRVNFASTGSLFRFRIVSAADITAYTMSEIIIRARQRGLEV
jgi:hypothetical protein